MLKDYFTNRKDYFTWLNEFVHSADLSGHHLAKSSTGIPTGILFFDDPIGHQCLTALAQKAGAAR